MPNSTRLIRTEAMSQSQITALKDLHDATGTCTCGAIFTALSSRFILGNFVSKHPTDPKQNGCVILGAYCLDCAILINELLKSLKDRAYRSMGGKNGLH